MNQKQSEDFDSAIKRLADEAESVYQAQSWHLMEKLLDKKKDKKRFFWWYWLTGVVIGAALIWAGIYFLRPTTSSVFYSDLQHPVLSAQELHEVFKYSIKSTIDRLFNPNDLTAVENPETNEASLLNELHASWHNLSKSPKTLPNIPQALNKPLSSNAARPNHIQDHDKLLDQSTSHSKVKASLQNGSHSSHFNTTPARTKELQITAPVIVDGDASTIDQKEKTMDPNKPNLSYQAEYPDRLFNLIPLQVGKGDLQFSRTMPFKKWSPPAVKAKTQLSRQAVMLGIGFAPEYSAVPNRKQGTLGYTHGFHLGYQLNRWAVSTGLQKSTKYYNANKEDYYELNPYYSKLTVININGVCSILQLPINIHYDLLKMKGFTLRLNAGVTSMRMDKEKYVLDYFHANWTKGQSTSNFALKNWFWFSDINGGISIRKSITNHLGISIDPYFQQPVKGVGKGKIKLNSFGSLFNINYKIPTR